MFIYIFIFNQTTDLMYMNNFLKGNRVKYIIKMQFLDYQFLRKRMVFFYFYKITSFDTDKIASNDEKNITSNL